MWVLLYFMFRFYDKTCLDGELREGFSAAWMSVFLVFNEGLSLKRAILYSGQYGTNFKQNNCHYVIIWMVKYMNAKECDWKMVWAAILSL